MAEQQRLYVIIQGCRLSEDGKIDDIIGCTFDPSRRDQAMERLASKYAGDTLGHISMIVDDPKVFGNIDREGGETGSDLDRQRLGSSMTDAKLEAILYRIGKKIRKT